MSHLRLLIYRVDDDTDQMTERDHRDLPSLPSDPGAVSLRKVEGGVHWTHDSGGE